jgi:hypothetical protein
MRNITHNKLFYNFFTHLKQSLVKLEWFSFNEIINHLISKFNNSIRFFCVEIPEQLKLNATIYILLAERKADILRQAFV